MEPWIPVSVPNQIAEVYTCSLVTMQFPSVKDFSVFFYRTSKEDQLLIPCGCKKYMQEKTHNKRRCNFFCIAFLHACVILVACTCFLACLHASNCLLTCFAFTQLLLHACLRVLLARNSNAIRFCVCFAEVSPATAQDNRRI